MRNKSWIELCPSCGTDDLVLDAGRNLMRRLGSWIQATMNVWDDPYGSSGYFGGSKAATCRRCSYHRTDEPEADLTA